MYRIGSVQAESLTRDIQSDAVRADVQASAFRNTVREVFGPDSAEFAESGSLQMFRGPLRVGMSSFEVAKARLRGRDYMVHTCAELITRLQQKILELRIRHEAGSIPPFSAEERHPIIAVATRDLISSGHLWEAVFAAGKAVVLHAQDRSGRHDLDGTNLMRTVFSRKDPVLKFNSLATSSELDEQEGMMHL